MLVGAGEFVAGVEGAEEQRCKANNQRQLTIFAPTDSVWSAHHRRLTYTPELDTSCENGGKNGGENDGARGVESEDDNDGALGVYTVPEFLGFRALLDRG